MNFKGQMPKETTLSSLSFHLHQFRIAVEKNPYLKGIVGIIYLQFGQNRVRFFPISPSGDMEMKDGNGSVCI